MFVIFSNKQLHNSPAAALWLLVLVLVVCTSSAAAQTVEDEGWELVHDKKQVKVYRRPVPNSDVIETLTLATIDATAERIFSVLTDYDHYPEFMPHIVESRIISDQGDSQQIFQRFRVSKLLNFLIKDRYYIIDNRLTYPQNNDNHYRIEWFINSEATESLQIDNAIATVINSGYWDLKETEEGGRTSVEYYLHTDPGGTIPKSFVNSGTTQSIPSVIQVIRNRLTSRGR